MTTAPGACSELEARQAALEGAGGQSRYRRPPGRAVVVSVPGVPAGGTSLGPLRSCVLGGSRGPRQASAGGSRPARAASSTAEQPGDVTVVAWAGRRRSTAWCGLVLLALGMLVTEIAQAAERVGIRAAAHPNYGRLVLDWAAPVVVRREANERRLVLRFDRPFEADLAPAEAPLQAYVEDLAQSPDRLELRLMLRPGVGLLRLAQYDPDLVVLDLAIGGNGATGPAPADVAVRTGRHEDFTRIVFDFDGPVDFTVERNRAKIDIIFDRRATFDAVALGRELRPLVDELSARANDAGRVGLRLRPGVGLDVFKLDDDKIVVDLREALDDAASGIDVADSSTAGRADAPDEPPGAAVEARAEHEVLTSPPVRESFETDAGEQAAAPEVPEPVRARGALPDASRPQTATGTVSPRVRSP